MALWWIGNIVFIGVVIPVVLILLNRLFRVVNEIKQYGDDALEHGVLLIAAMDNVEHLLTTRDTARRLKDGVQRYGAALNEIL